MIQQSHSLGIYPYKTFLEKDTVHCSSIHSSQDIETTQMSINKMCISFFYFFAFSRAAPTAYGGSQARVLIRAVAAGLHKSHSNAGSEPCLQPTPQLMATPDP